jgi:hypothetical protein
MVEDVCDSVVVEDIAEVLEELTLKLLDAVLVKVDNSVTEDDLMLAEEVLSDEDSDVVEIVVLEPITRVEAAEVLIVNEAEPVTLVELIFPRIGPT